MKKHDKIIEEYCQRKKISTEKFEIKNNSISTQLIYFNNPGNKKTVIFIHSYSCDKYFPLLDLLFKLLDNSYSLLIFDLPGHGKENHGYFSVKDSIQLLSNVIDFSKNKLNKTKEDLVLLGYSLGGFLSLYESSKNSISGVITISAPHTLNIRPFVFFELFSLLSFASLKQIKYYSLNYFLPSFGIFRKEFYPVRSLAKNKVEEMGKEVLSHDLLNIIKKSEIPYLQIHGIFDLFVPISQAKNIYKNYGAKNKKTSSYFFSNHLTIGFKKSSTNKILNWLNQINID